MKEGERKEATKYHLLLLQESFAWPTRAQKSKQKGMGSGTVVEMQAKAREETSSFSLVVFGPKLLFSLLSQAARKKKKLQGVTTEKA